MTGIPTIDTSRLRPGAPAAEREAAVAELDAACRTIGFFVATGHRVPPAGLHRLLQLAQRFFAQPPAAKQEAAIGLSDDHTGYVGLEEEQLQPDLRPDAKECLDLALEPSALPGHRGPAGEPPGTVPDLDGLREAVIGYQRAALATALDILGGLEEALGSPGAFTTVMDRPRCFLRLLHYPPRPAPVERQLGCGAHTDYGLITLLATDGVSGLEVADRGGRWLAVDGGPDALIVNLGDMLARWSNDRYVSTPHRVGSPSRDRYSAPFFVNPRADAVVSPLASCVDDGHPARHRPITAGDYLRSRFDDTHLYRQQR